MINLDLDMYFSIHVCVSTICIFINVHVLINIGAESHLAYQMKVRGTTSSCDLNFLILSTN